MVPITGLLRGCLSNKILNPKTNRCVNKDGKIGKKIILMNGLKWSNNSCYIDSLLFAIKVSYPELFESDLREIKNGDEKIRDIQKRIKEEILNGFNNWTVKTAYVYCSKSWS